MLPRRRNKRERDSPLLALPQSCVVFLRGLCPSPSPSLPPPRDLLPRPSLYRPSFTRQRADHAAFEARQCMPCKQKTTRPLHLKLNGGRGLCQEIFLESYVGLKLVRRCSYRRPLRMNLPCALQEKNQTHSRCTYTPSHPMPHTTHCTYTYRHTLTYVVASIHGRRQTRKANHPRMYLSLFPAVRMQNETWKAERRNAFLPECTDRRGTQAAQSSYSGLSPLPFEPHQPTSSTSGTSIHRLPCTPPYT